MKTVLLCTFTDKKQLHSCIDNIINNTVVVYGKIFVLTTDTPYEVICSYNIESNPNVKFLDNTILVHRRRDTNTMYTINALNALIRQMNNNVLDTSYVVDWENYRNSLLVTDENGFKKVNTKIFSIERVIYK